MKKIVYSILSIVLFLAILSCSSSLQSTTDLEPAYFEKRLSATEINYVSTPPDTTQNAVVGAVHSIKVYRVTEKSIKSMAVDTTIKIDKEKKYEPLEKLQ